MGIPLLPITESGKRKREAVCAGGFPLNGKALPIIPVSLNEKCCRGLIDTGSTLSIVSSRYATNTYKAGHEIIGVDGKSIHCEGAAKLKMRIGSCELLHHFLVMKELLPDVDVIIGLDVIHRLGGVNRQWFLTISWRRKHLFASIFQDGGCCSFGFDRK